MNPVDLNCPLPGGPPPSGDECNLTKTAIWSSPGTSYVNFFIQSVDDTIVSFRFTPISNNGSNITVNVIYGDNGVRTTKSTYNLGLLPSQVTKYHILNLGAGIRTNQVVSFEVITVGGTSGSFQILFDCDVDVTYRDFCYVPANRKPSDLCDTCPFIYRVYWDTSAGNFPFPPGEIFLDPELQTEAPLGFYRIKEQGDTLTGPTSGVRNSFPIVYWYDGNVLTKQDVCGNYINCGESITLNHVKGDYKFSSPYIPNVKGPKLTKNLNYSVKPVIVWFPTITHGFTTFSISIAGGEYEDFCFTITDANANPGQTGYLSFSFPGTSTSSFYFSAKPETLIRPLFGNSVTVRVNFNGNNQNTQALLVRMVVGQKRNYKSNNTIQTSISTTCQTPIYGYIVGVHPYSPFDSKISIATRTTKIFSLQPINQWSTVNRTIVYSDPLLVFPAFPWYYGYNNSVYKVGKLYQREIGVIKSYQAKYSIIGRLIRWITWQGNKSNITVTVSDVKNWRQKHFTGYDYVPSCVYNTMEWGAITEILAPDTLIEAPTKYFYFLGYETTSKLASSQKYFTYTQIPQEISFPIGGLQHLFLRNTISNTLFGPDLPGPNFYYYPFTSWLGDATVYAGYAFAVSLAVMVGVEIIASSGNVLGGTLSICAEPVTCAVIIAVILAVLLAIELLKIRRFSINEDCDNFYLGYSSGPFLESGNTIYFDSSFIDVRDGYYCDGAYFYTQSSGSITVKEQSFYQDKANSFRTVYVPLPDSPTFITDIYKLYFLCYVAGRPEYTYIYKSQPIYEQTNGVAPIGDLISNLGITVNFEEGLFGSNISQEDADQQAQYLADQISSGYTYQSTIQKIGTEVSTFIFSHELKIENFPSQFELAFDNSNLSGITVGKKLYYDDDGFYSALTGFYSLNANDNLNYKFFYQVSAGTIIDIWTMSASTATTVTSQETLQTETLSQSNLDYTSSWYLYSTKLDEIDFSGPYAYVNNSLFSTATTWNDISFYTGGTLVRGFIDTPSTLENFYIYDSNFSLSASTQAPEGYYAEVPIVSNLEPFSYATGQTITLSILQVCSETEGLNGIKVTCYNEEGDETPSIEGVEFSLIIYMVQNILELNEYYNFDLKIEANESYVFQLLDPSFIGQIDYAEIATIVSPNPIQRITFTGGTFTSCNTPTPTPSPETWTPTPTPTNTLTPSVTKSPTPTPSLALGECWAVSEIYGGDVYVSYIARDGSNQCITISNLNTVNICIKAGTSGAVFGYNTAGCTGSGVSINLSNLSTNCTTDGDCSVSPTPTPTLTKTPTQTPQVTPSNTATPSATAYLQSILLSTPQLDGCTACALATYSTTGYTNPYDTLPTSGDTIYSNNTGTSTFNGASQWFQTSWGGEFAIYSIRINSSGVIIDIKNCATCPTSAPTPTVTPAITPTPSITPAETPTPTPTPSTQVYFYYNTDTYNCGISGGSCGDPQTGTAVLRFSTSQISTWFSDGITAYSRTGNASGPSYDVDGDFLATGASCVAACIA